MVDRIEATVQVVVDSLEGDIYCVLETHLKSRHNVNFTKYIRNDANIVAALLIREEYQLLTSSVAAALVKSTDNRHIFVFC